MKDFVETKESNYSALPMKDRIKLIQTQNRNGGIKLTWKEAKNAYRTLMQGRVFINDIYQVVYETPEQIKECVRHPQLKGLMEYLSIKRIDKKPVRSWSDFQEIKNKICENGKNKFAVEIYPPEGWLVNTANQYHLWVFPANTDIGFGFNKRVVNEIEGENTIVVKGQKFTTNQNYKNK
tara:strand:+ start:867 stop:1403 length:537 start_codon:yes stop_codon:yes gene_type:complete